MNYNGSTATGKFSLYNISNSSRFIVSGSPMSTNLSEITYNGKLELLQIGGDTSGSCNCNLDVVWLFYNYDISSAFSTWNHLLFQLMMNDVCNLFII